MRARHAGPCAAGTTTASRAGPTGDHLSLVGGCAAIVLAAVAWIMITGLLARAQLDHVRQEVPQLRTALAAGNVAQARSVSVDLARHAHQAHQLTTGPAWFVGANIPVMGTPLRTTRTITSAATA